MKATELRIGNKVYIDYLDVDTGKWHQQIIEISYRDIYNLINSNHMLKGAYEGIPLTEDWLVKLSFCKSNTQDKFYTKDNCVGVSIADNKFIFIQGNFVCQLVLRELFYVHQLQNLYYALTELELTTP